MKKLLFTMFFLCFSQLIFAEENLNPRHDAYLKYLHQYPQTIRDLGNASHGEIEILQDPNLFQKIEEKTLRDVGIIAEDNYWIWINDAVQFPNGKSGVYGRIVWRCSLEGIPGVAVLPVLSDGKILLITTYRHATRSWEFELPRGSRDQGETIENAALRELKEETGLVAKSLIYLGEILPDSGLTNTVVPLFLADILIQEAPEHQDSEAIASVEHFSLEEIKKGFVQGYLIREIHGIKQKVYMRDPFLAFALFQAENKRIPASI